MLGILAAIGLGSALIFSDETEEQTEGLGKISDPKEEKKVNQFIDGFTKKFSGKSFVNKATGLKVRVFKTALINTFTQFELNPIERPANLTESYIDAFQRIDKVIEEMPYQETFKNKSISKSTYFHIFRTGKHNHVIVREVNKTLYLHGIYSDYASLARAEKLDKTQAFSDSKLYKIFHQDVNIQLEKKQKATESNKVETEKKQAETKPTSNATEKPKTETKPVASETKADNQTPKKGANLQIIDYSEKAIALKGTTKEMSSAIKGLGIWAKFNAKLNDGEGGKFAGWIFSKKDRETVEEFVKQYTNGEVITVKKEASGAEEKPNSKLTFAQHIQAYKSLKEAEERIVRGLRLEEGKHNFQEGYHYTLPFGEYITDHRWKDVKSIYKKDGSVDTILFARAYTDKEGQVYIISEYVLSLHGNKDYYRTELIIKKSGKKSNTPYGYHVDLSELTEITIPAKVFVPKNKRKPHYDLSKSPKLKRDILLLEVMLGKMDIRMSMTFDGMQDMSVSVDDEWYTPTLKQIPDVFYRESPRLWKETIITWGNAGVEYEAKYNGKDAKAWLYLGDEQEERKKEIKAVDHKAMAEKFFKTADSLKSKIDKKRNELDHALTNTPKRMAQSESKRAEVRSLELHESYFRALGEAWNANTIHEKLKLISPQQSKKHLVPFENKRSHVSYGYHYAYDVDTSKFRYESNYEHHRATLKEIGVNSLEEAREVHKLLGLLIYDKDDNAEDRKKEAKIRSLENQWKLSKQKGFFPTPTPLAQRMVSEANIQAGDTILEPSAGVGHIAEAIREEYPQNSLEVVEYMQSLSELLELKGFKVVGDDFLKHNKKYDRIIMNPPFEKLADIDHVKHAYSLLKEGGRIVSIMSESPFFNSQNKAKSFRNWLDEVGGVSEQLPENSFKGKDAFKETGVSTRLVIIDKSEGDNSKKKGNKNLSEIEKLKAEAEELKAGETGQSDYEAKQERRQDRFDYLADKHDQQADFYSERSGTHLPWGGEPIKVGHHSEKRHRKAQERAFNDMDKTLEHRNKSEYYGNRKVSTAISSDDDKALRKLKEKLAKQLEQHEFMKDANAKARKNKEDKPFPTWQLSNSNQNIRSTRTRIADLEKRASEQTTTTRYGNIEIIDNVEDNRLQIIFPSKPDKEERDVLKQNGFKWSPKNSAWQRLRGTSANYALEDVVKTLGWRNEEIEESMNSKTGVLDRFVVGIHTDEKRFQNRDNAYSSESHDRIVEAVKNGSFNWAIFDPIIVWKDPKDDKIYVISGHSRLAAFKTLSKSNAQFKKIPSKLFEGTESEAIDLALNSNTLATKETDLERANYYRKKREACEIEPKKGLSGTKLRKDCFKQVVELAKKYEGKNATKLINLSFLNPKGYLYDILKRLENSDESSKNIAWTVGQWMGEARKLYPQLTDAHENEVAKWLIEKGYGTKASQFTNKRLFLDRLKKSIDRKTEFGKFKENEPLNIAWTITKNHVEEEFDNILHELTKNSQEAEKLVKDKADEFYNGVEQGKITREKAEELLKPYIQSFSVAKSKLAKHVNSKQKVMQQGKNQTSLFGVRPKVGEHNHFGSDRCERSRKPAKDCECRCGGKYHGLNGNECLCGCECETHTKAKKSKKAKAVIKPKKTRSKNKLFSGIAEQAETSEGKAETFYLDGEIGMFLGYVEQYEYSVVLRGAKGAGKTRFLFQIMNAFANEGKKTAFFSLEIGKHSNIISKMSDEYLSDKAKQNIMIADEVPNGLQDVKDAAEDFDLICIDSYGKLGVKQEEFDKLRKQYPNTMFIFIFQSTTAGTARGGSRAEYDCGIVIQVNEGGKAICEKNRYGNTDFTYLVFEQRLK